MFSLFVKHLQYFQQVCEELECEDAVFPLAVNTLDRFIQSNPDIRRAQLQLLAVVCLSLASKIRDCNTLSLNDLSHMTEYSASVNEIQVRPSSRKAFFLTIFFLSHCHKSS